MSPGFRVPPASAVANAEVLVEEPGNPGVLIRKINHAVLREVSLVTAATYDGTEIDVRSMRSPAASPSSPNPPAGDRRRRIWL